MLDHLDPDCTGEFVLLEDSRLRAYWECPTCGAVADHSPEALGAAMRQYGLRVLLERLAAEGGGIA